MGVLSHPTPRRRKSGRTSVITQIRRGSTVRPTDLVDSQAAVSQMSQYPKAPEAEESEEEAEEEPEAGQADISWQIGFRRIEVQSLPSKARVYVDDTKMGLTPLFIEVLKDETVTVRVSLQGYRSVKFEVGPDSKDSFGVELKRY